MAAQHCTCKSWSSGHTERKGSQLIQFDEAMLSFAISGKECLSQIPLLPWGIFTVLLLNYVTFKQPILRWPFIPKAEADWEWRDGWEAAASQQPLTAYNASSQGNRDQSCLKLSPQQGETSFFRNLEQCWESSEREREREATDPFLSRLFPHICEVSAEVVKERLGLFLLEWHISMPH